MADAIFVQKSMSARASLRLAFETSETKGYTYDQQLTLHSLRNFILAEVDTKIQYDFNAAEILPK